MLTKIGKHTIMDTTTTLPKITILEGKHIGKCGKLSKAYFHFPMFLMGCCGDEDAVISYSLAKPKMKIPKKMDKEWFGKIALHIKKYPYFDWDWYSFQQNILLPNKEHIRIACEIKDDEILERLMEDGYVFLNNYYNFPDKEWFADGKDIGFPPNQKYFLTEKRLEY